MRTVLAAGLALAFALPASADDAPRPLRLIGEAPSAKAPAPNRFVIDATVSKGDGDFESDLSGWFAALGETTGSGSVDGSCVEKRCTLSVDLDGGKFALVGDLLEAAGATPARFTFKEDYSEGPPQQGAASLQPIAGAIAGLEPLAPIGAHDEAELDELLMWNHQSTGFGSVDKGDPPSSFQRSALAEWQAANGRPATGLIFASDLAALRAAAAADRAKARWTLLGGPAKGWSAGYPAALLPAASSGVFASADGKARLEVSVDPPLTDEGWDKLVDQLTEDRDTISGRSYTRVNDDMELRYIEKGVVTVASYHSRKGGLARLVFTYPESDEETWRPWDTILQRALVVTDDLSR
jgi:hypothetical protein